jgi:dipeptidyl aminopeptidase/acylaminoacyl peptidase
MESSTREKSGGAARTGSEDTAKRVSASAGARAFDFVFMLLRHGKPENGCTSNSPPREYAGDAFREIKNMRARLRAGLLGFLFAAAAAGAAPPPPPSSAPFTLDQVLSYPFPLEIRASRTGARAAWIENRKGVRNVWVAEGPAWKARRLTDAGADDGQELTQLQFSRDGRRLVWVRGGDHDANWPSPGGVEPNPALATAKPAIEIWGVDFDEGNPKKLADGDGPAISPDGERVAFVKDHQASWVPFDGKKDAASLFFCRGDIGSLAWSPDGKLLAFVSDRGDHSLIGIFSSEKEPIRFVDPSISRDSNPVWSPDGSRIAFIREPEGRPKSSSRRNRIRGASGRPTSRPETRAPSGPPPRRRRVRFRRPTRGRASTGRREIASSSSPSSTDGPISIRWPSAAARRRC